MLKIFRRVRQRLIFQNKIGNYLLYAIGEITLVMIGILLALQVNNWNEGRKIKNELNSILNIVSLDLKRDTMVATGVIDYYKKNEEFSLKVINREINMNNIDSFPQCRNLVSVIKSFTIQTKGYEMLKDFSSQNTLKNDSLVTNISQFYTPFIQLIDDSNKFIRDEVLSNINVYKNKSWFIDWSQGRITPEMKKYFATSEEYRKQVASHNIFAAKNHKTFVDIYKKAASQLLDGIEKRLEKEK